ncbi:DUF1661 domain-containing protein [Porphyromonas gingivalis]|uniref:DUF1661 domain-containing protein n=1 Tax=Porphyromonas gingivalis TaxID=837 RepID=UPI001E2F7A87|nr:DUF1661 domain-containing protein [Porphyromonas gingivalis]MDH7903329.1 DUF1661 domain-containing protein [Porphyromonas gingivalis]WKD52542.1 DUF1661 domain-containing protein [Porphyromonas gingivalis]WKD54592.1 DUF1661 domain-containing protein [Porphyromonas gingivalis]
MVREVKNSRATRKKFSRHFSRKHAPQSEQLWFEKIRSEYIHPRARGVAMKLCRQPRSPQ